MRHSTVKIDELDKYFFENFAIIIDTATGFFKKLEKLLQPYQDELRGEIEKFIKEHKKYKKTYEYGPEYIPFKVYSKQKKINNLDNVFELMYGFYIQEKKGKRTLKSFSIYFGFYFNKVDDEYPFNKCFYFGIENNDVNNYGALQEVEYYNNIKQNIESNNNSFKIYIKHPVDGDAQYEYFYLTVEELVPELLEESFIIYKNQIVIPFLKSLK